MSPAQKRAALARLPASVRVARLEALLEVQTRRLDQLERQLDTAERQIEALLGVSR